MPETELVDDLNMLLKGEISATETYRHALEKVEHPEAKKMMAANHQCHTARVGTLHEAVKAAGGTPAEGSGLWGAFAKAVEGTATVMGDKASVAALEEGEDKGLADYKKVAEKHGASSSCVNELKSKQESSHAKCRDLKHAMA